MEKDFNYDNSKKLIVGVSILFCTVILIIGVTAAFFTQSDTKDTGNIVSTDQITLDYQDNVDNMRSDLIPINEEDLVKAYNKTGDEKCKDDLGYNVCSIYQFTIINNSDVSQSLIIDLIPRANSFHNLKFNLKDITNNKEIMNNVKLTYLSEVEINLLKNITLNNNSNNTYELTFYIENKSEEDQSSLDSGKRFGANIRVNSVTTGNYILKGFGEECWTATDNNTKLTEFHGLDENGNVKEECSGYIKKDTDNLYIVNIPSKYAGSDVTTLGNSLFAFQDGNGIRQYYKKIKEITIQEGITKLDNGEEYWSENGESWWYNGTFAEIADYEEIDTGMVPEKVYNHYLTISFPNTLTDIGDMAFINAGIKNLILSTNLKFIRNMAFADNIITTSDVNPLIIPASVISIGDWAFSSNNNLTKITFGGANDDSSQLETIGIYAFEICNLTYTEPDSPLVLPKNRLTTIREGAFLSRSYLNFIQYNGTNTDILNNTTRWYNSSVTTLNP